MPARLSSLFARRARPGPPGAPAAAPEEPPAEAPSPPPLPMHPAALLRERRELMRAREATIRDIGGLALEMRRRERWMDRLLQARCDEALEIERRVAEVDSLLAAVTVARAAPGAARCKCGAPVPAGAHFCSHCGRPAPATPPVVSCSHCGQPVPAEANFCAFCGNPVAAEEYEGPVDAVDDTLARRRSDVED